jgi:hypothetical protein
VGVWRCGDWLMGLVPVLLFKIIASGVYWPLHEIEIMKALYLLKKIPYVALP